MSREQRGLLWRAPSLTSWMALVLYGLLSTAAAGQSGSLRYTIMVSEFENRSNWHGQWRLGDAWGEILTDQLNQTGRFIVVAEQDMRKHAIQEQASGTAGLTAQGRKTPVRGQLAPAQLLVKGVITKFETQSSSSGGGLNYKGIGLKKAKTTTSIGVTIQIVDSTSGMVVASQSVDGEAIKKKRGISVRRSGFSGQGENADNGSAHDAVRDAVKKGVAWMVGQLDHVPWRGSVVLVDAEHVIINRGRREGVVEKQRFSFGESKVIRDPDTGEVIDEYVSEQGQLEVIRVNDKTSVCRVTVGDVSTLYPGIGVMPRS